MTPRRLEPMRLLFMIEGLGRGGAEHQAEILLTHLPRRGVETHLVYYTGPEDMLEGIRKAGVHLHPLRPARRIWPLDVTRHVLGLVRQHRIPVVQSFLGAFDILSPTFRIFRPGLKVLTSRRSLDEYLPPRQVRMLRLTGRVATGVVANARAVGESVERNEGRLGTRLHVIYNAMPLPHPISAFERTAARQEYGLDPGDFVIAFPAHFRRGKGHDHLLEVASRVIAEHPQAFFLLAGEMERTAAYRRNAEIFLQGLEERGLKERVRCLGLIPDSRPLLAAADAVINLSDMEGMSNTVMEGMALGLPIVATAVGGTPELVEDGREGFLVPAGDAGAAAERLGRLAADKDLRARLGAAGREKMRERFSIDAMVDGYVGLYKHLVD